MLTITILIFIFAGVLFVFYNYFTSKIASLRRQIIFLTKQNTELRDKLNKIIYEKNQHTSDE